MRRIGERSLWVGNARDLSEPREILDRGVEAVVELADSEQLAVLPRELVRCRFPLSDGGDNPDWLLQLAANSVAAMLTAKVPILVCCSAGMSRSPCVAAAAISVAENRPFDDALSEVATGGPVDVSPRLAGQFRRLLG